MHEDVGVATGVRGIRACLAALVLVLFGVLAPLAQEPAPDALTTLTLMREAALRLPGVVTSTIDQTEMSLRTTFADGKDTVSFPDNLSVTLSLLATEAERSAEVTRHMAGLIDRTPDEWTVSDNLANLLPVLRPAGVVAGTLRSAGLSDTSAVVETEFLPGLSMFLVIDQPQTMSYVSDEMLITSGMSLERLHETALGNLAARIASSDPAMAFEQVGPGLSMLLLDGTYEASTLFLTEVWRDVAKDYRQLLVAVPARDLVILGEGGDPQVRQALTAIALTYFDESAYPVTSSVLAWKDDRWVLAE